MKPYKDLLKTKHYIIREFDENVDSIELMWHRDKETRLIEILEPGDKWQLQYDNELPFDLKEGMTLLIPKLEWHRVIKGEGKLKLKINLED